MSGGRWLGPRRALAAAAGCLILVACGSGGSSSHPPTAKPAAHTSAASTPAAAAEPASGPGAQAAITANWQTVFNGKAPIPSRVALVQDGSQVASFIQAQAKTSLGQAATGSTAAVSSVTITAPTLATVRYQVLLLGTPLLKNQVGTAVYEGGVWKVGIASFCGLAYLEYPKGSPQLPAVCQG